MARCAQTLASCFLLVASTMAAYEPYSYSAPKYHLKSYQTYDKRAAKSYDSGYGSSRYVQSPYGSPYGGHGGKGHNNDGYGYQTRTTYVDNNKYYLPEPYNKHGGDHTYGLLRGSFYKQASPSASYHEKQYGPQRKTDYSYKTETKKSYGNKEYSNSYLEPKESYGQKEYGYKSYGSSKGNEYGYEAKPSYGDYGISAYDPCSKLPEGDYALQAEFTALYPGIDAQCNFVKCANYRSYVNPCSVGTKNDEYGGPHAKHGFCADTDYKHYCGVFPPGDTYEYEH